MKKLMRIWYILVMTAFLGISSPRKRRGHEASMQTAGILLALFV